MSETSEDIPVVEIPKNLGAMSADELIRLITNLESSKTKDREQYVLDKKNIDDTKAKEDKLYEEFKALRDKRIKAERDLESLVKKNRDIDAEITRIQREERLKRALEDEKNKFAEWSKQVDLNTAGRKWREFAYDHQIIGAKKLAFSGSGILGDAIGLGKTLTSLIWADMMEAKKVVVIAPKEILRNFQNEIKTWAGDRNMIDIVSQPKSYRDLMWDVLSHDSANKFIITINLEAWRKDMTIIDELIKLQVDILIIDEAHNLKNSKSKAFEGVAKLRYAVNKCPVCKSNDIKQTRREDPATYQRLSKKYWECQADTCEWGSFDEYEGMSVTGALPMTGTMILNKPEEFWPLGYLIDKKLFPNVDTFLREYCYKLGNKYKFWEGSVENLTNKIGNKLVVRDRHDVGIKIPPQTVQYYDLPFSMDNYPEQFRAYYLLIKHSAIMLDNMEAMEMTAFIALLTRFRQMMAWPEGISVKDERGNVKYKCIVKESIKLDKAEELILDLVNRGERVVVFSQFKDPLREMHRRINGAAYEDNDANNENFMASVIYDGDTKQDTRDEVRVDFDAATFNPESTKFIPDYQYKWDVVFANYKVGGTGINLNAAAHMIILDREWNPGKEDQSFGRIDRMGQTKETTVHVIRAHSDKLSFNVDAFMSDILDEKRDLVGAFDTSAKTKSAQMLALMRKDLEDLEGL